MIGSLLNLTRDSILAPLGLLPYTRSFAFELLDMIIMAFAIGYIFMDYIKKPTPKDYDPLLHYQASSTWKHLKFAALVAGPAVVLHELSHKLVAMAFGANAVLYAPYGFYLLVIILKMIGFPFIFFVGGFVSIQGALTPLQSSLVSFAGPGMNFILYGLSILAVKNVWIKRKYLDAVVWFGRLNLFLGIFNMIPLPGFDGYKVFAGLIQAIF